MVAGRSTDLTAGPSAGERRAATTSAYVKVVASMPTATPSSGESSPIRPTRISSGEVDQHSAVAAPNPNPVIENAWLASPSGRPPSVTAATPATTTATGSSASGGSRSPNA